MQALQVTDFHESFTVRLGFAIRLGIFKILPSGTFHVILTGGNFRGSPGDQL